MKLDNAIIVEGQIYIPEFVKDEEDRLKNGWCICRLCEASNVCVRQRYSWCDNVFKDRSVKYFKKYDKGVVMFDEKDILSLFEREPCAAGFWRKVEEEKEEGVKSFNKNTN